MTHRIACSRCQSNSNLTKRDGKYWLIWLNILEHFQIKMNSIGICTVGFQHAAAATHLLRHTSSRLIISQFHPSVLRGKPHIFTQVGFTYAKLSTGLAKLLKYIQLLIVFGFHFWFFIHIFERNWEIKEYIKVRKIQLSDYWQICTTKWLNIFMWW